MSYTRRHAAGQQNIFSFTFLGCGFPVRPQRRSEPESIEWIIEPSFFTVVWSGFSFPPLPSATCLCFSVFLCAPGQATDREGWGGGGGVVRSYIIRGQESLVLYTLWSLKFKWTIKFRNFTSPLLHSCKMHRNKGLPKGVFMNVHKLKNRDQRVHYLYSYFTLTFWIVGRGVKGCSTLTYKAGKEIDGVPQLAEGEICKGQHLKQRYECTILPQTDPMTLSSHGSGSAKEWKDGFGFGSPSSQYSEAVAA